MRITFLFRLLAASSLLHSYVAIADTYPSRPITIVSPFGAGGATDVVARAAAQQLSKHIGQQVIVQGVPGSGGGLAASRVASGAPDGYTLFFGTLGTQVFNVAMYKSLPYDPVADFEPIALVARYPLVLVVNQSAPYSNLSDFIRAAKERPGTLSFGSGGVGSTAHVGCELLNDATGIKALHVPYRTTNPATIDLIRGDIHYLCDLIAGAIPNIEGGKTRALAVMTEKRTPLLPHVPTIAESGYPGFAAYTWNALFARRGTPPEVIKKINDALVAGLREPEIRASLAKLGVELPTSSEEGGAYLRGFVKAESDKWLPLVRRLDVSSDSQ